MMSNAASGVIYGEYAETLGSHLLDVASSPAYVSRPEERTAMGALIARYCEIDKAFEVLAAPTEMSLPEYAPGESDVYGAIKARLQKPGADILRLTGLIDTTLYPYSELSGDHCLAAELYLLAAKNSNNGAHKTAQEEKAVELVEQSGLIKAYDFQKLQASVAAHFDIGEITGDIKHYESVPQNIDQSKGMLFGHSANNIVSDIVHRLIKGPEANVRNSLISCLGAVFSNQDTANSREMIMQLEDTQLLTAAELGSLIKVVEQKQSDVHKLLLPIPPLEARKARAYHDIADKHAAWPNLTTRLRYKIGARSFEWRSKRAQKERTPKRQPPYLSTIMIRQTIEGLTHPVFQDHEVMDEYLNSISNDIDEVKGIEDTVTRQNWRRIGSFLRLSPNPEGLVNSSLIDQIIELRNELPLNGRARIDLNDGLFRAFGNHKFFADTVSGLTSASDFLYVTYHENFARRGASESDIRIRRELADWEYRCLLSSLKYEEEYRNKTEELTGSASK